MAIKPDGTIRIDSSIDSKGFNNGIGSMLGALKPLAAAISTIFLTVIGVKAVKAVALLASEFDRMSVAAQAVGQLQGVTASATRKLVGELVESGIQTDIANRAFVNFAREGLDTGLLPALAQGAQDLNVFSAAGESSSDVLDRLLFGVLNLNSLMLRRAGVAVDVLDAERKYGATIGKTTQQMSIQEKRAGVLAAVIEKLKTVDGLYALSQKTLAGQMSSNIRVVNELKAAIGGPFQSAMFRVVKGFNDMAKAVTRALNAGGPFRTLLVNIGAVASIVAEQIARLFAIIGRLFGIEKVSSPATSGIGELTEGFEEAAEAEKELIKQTKIAKGALAGFDELNILAQDTGAGAGGLLGGLEDTGGGILGEIDASQFLDPMEEIEKRAEEMKLRLAEILATPTIAKVLETIRAFADLVTTALLALRPIWDWIKINLLSFNEDDALIIGVLDIIILVLKGLEYAIENNKGVFRGFAVVIGILLIVLFALLSPMFAIMALVAGLVIILLSAGKAFTMFKELAVLAGTFIGLSLKRMIISIRNFAKGIMNQVIDFVNRMVQRVIGGINSIIRAANTVGSILPGFSPLRTLAAPQIPRLARGAVIPPNAEFAAILGDQSNGRNLEAPEALIRQIVREESGGSREIKIVFTGSGAEIARLLKPALAKEEIRVGNSLVTSGVVR